MKKVQTKITIGNQEKWWKHNLQNSSRRKQGNPSKDAKKIENKESYKEYDYYLRYVLDMYNVL